MEFPLHKEWMGELNRVGDVYLQGVKEFLKYAIRNLKSEMLSCPCMRCRNCKYLHWKMVELHLVQWGFQENYKVWNFHGEREFPFIPEHLLASKTVQVEDNPLANSKLNDLIDDAYGVHVLQAKQFQNFVNFEDDQDHQGGDEVHNDTGVHQDKDYIRLKSEAARPLYPNCNENHTSVTVTMEKLIEIQSTQCESSPHSLENDVLSQHFGKDKRGRTRGVGKVSSTKLKATLPIRNELEKVKAEVQQISSNTSMTNEKMENLATYVKRLVNIYEGKEFHVAASGSQTPHNQQNEHNSSSLLETLATPSPSQPKFGAEFYYMKDPLCTKNIAVGTIDSKATTGTVVHHRPMQAWEVKVCVVKVLEGMDNQPLWLGNQGCADNIGEVVGGYVVWPTNLLEKVVE